jgi:hypothetical protein
MDWEKLSREQKQMLGLVVLVAITAGFICITYIIKPMGANWKKNSADIKELADKVRGAEVLTREAAQIQRDTLSTNQELTELNRAFMAEEDFAWASRQIYDIGRELGLALVVQEGKTQGLKGGIGHIAYYGIAIQTTCSFDELRALVTKIQAISPYTTISTLSITPSPDDFEKHRVALKVQWPIFKDLQLKSEIERAS